MEPGKHGRRQWVMLVYLAASLRTRQGVVVLAEPQGHVTSAQASLSFRLNTTLLADFVLYTYLLAMTQLKDWVHLTVPSALHSAVWDCYELPSGISAGQFLLVCFRAFH